MSNGERLLEWKKKYRVSPEELCTSIGCSIGTLRKMFRDERVGEEYWTEAFKLMLGPPPWLQQATA